MALFQGTIFPKTLGFETQVYVCVPQDGRRYNKDGPVKTLILLHGISDNAAGWIRYGAADALSAKYNVAVVIPEGQKSLWLDMKYGGQYTTYLTGELPELIGKIFQVPVNRESLMIAGLSMGGYGALHAAFSQPDAFYAAGSFSGVTDMAGFVAQAEELATSSDCGGNFAEEVVAAVGIERRLDEKEELKYLLEKMVNAKEKPRIYLSCGKEDRIVYEQNKEFYSYIKTLPVDARCETWSGVHDWNFWNVALERFLEHMVGAPLEDDVFGGIPVYRKKQIKEK